jgi:stage V sporulation protein K
MVFTGNPGTGKTTIARLISQIYKSMGILNKGQFIETDRAGLVGGYLGQTAIKTQEIVESALGGVLFIDEAYSLTDNTHGHDRYGQEAVSTLLKLMEDHRDDLIVIVAGYTEPMQKFIRSNPGLQSRFNKFLHFDDYGPAELTEIFQHFAVQGDYKLHPATELKLHNVFTTLYGKRDETFGNARLARNLFEKAINAHANRMVAVAAPDEASLVTLYPEDIPNA